MIGQRWTAIRPAGGDLALLHVPGVVATDVRGGIWGGRGNAKSPAWVDLTATNMWASGIRDLPGGFGDRAWRRAMVRGRELNDGAGAIRRAWPIVELPSTRRLPWGGVGTRGGRCQCFSMQLSSKQDEFVRFVETVRRRSSVRQAVALAEFQPFFRAIASPE